MNDPNNLVNRTLNAEKVTGIRGGTAASAQQGISQGYYNTGGLADLLARGIRWLISRFRRRAQPRNAKV